MAQRLVFCRRLQSGKGAPTALAPQLLLTNKQIRMEGRAIMLKTNNFSVILNQASYLGYSSGTPLNASVVGGDIASIPSKWTSHIRHCVHQMRHLTLYVTLNSEREKVSRLFRKLLEDKKLKVAAIVGTALGELCEILSFSNNLSTLKVSFLDLGTNQLTTGNEHKVLRCLRELKGLKHIEICGVPKAPKEYLEKVMRLSK